MKIAMVTWFYPPDIHGGGEISCKLLVDNLRKKGHEVDVFVLDKIFPGIKSKISLNIKTHEYFAGKFTDYDVVHCYNTSLLPSIGQLTEDEDINSYATLNGIIFSPSLAVYKHKFLSPKYYRNKIFFNHVKNIKMFSTLCEYWRRKWILDGIPARNISVITNMIDPDFKVEKRISHDGYNILHVGNYSPTRAEEIKSVVDIFSRLKNNDIRLTMIGSGSEEKKHLVEHYNVPDRVDILGKVDNDKLSKYYAQSDFFLHPSILPKGNDRVIIEAMQHGCVVLTHCNNEFSPIIENGKSGFLIYPNISEIYVTNIGYLLKFPEKIKTISEHAKKRVKEVCSPDKITKKYLENYRYI